MSRGLCAGVAALLLLEGALLAPMVRAQLPSPGGLDVVLVLDHSGSMKHNDPQRLMIQAACDFVEKLGPGDAAGLVVFGGQARAVHPLAALAIPGQRERLLAEIDRIRYADPYTNMSAGIERGMYELKQHGRAEAVPILVFITDGIMDTGSGAKDVEMREWLRSRLLPEAAQRGILVFSVALTEEADYALLQEMASVTGGDYYRAIIVKEIAGIFGRIHAKIQERRALPPSAPSTPGAAVPSPVAVSSPILAWAWLWIVGAAGLAILLVAGLIMVRRLRPAPGPAERPPSAPQVPLIPAAPAEPPLPSASLRNLRTGKTVQLSKTSTRIGREPDNDLVIAEPQVSGHHAEIECRQGHFYLRDLRSTNGTWINRQRVEKETLLRSGDVIRFDQLAYAFSGPDVQVGGTMVRDLREGTLVSEAPRARPAAPALAETAVVDTDATVEDSPSTPRCPAHAHFEATERCERCGNLWCALCNPPVSGERVCRNCRASAKGHPR